MRTKAAISQHSQNTPQYIPSTVQSVQFKVLEINGSVPVPMPTPASFTIPGSVCTLVVGFYQCSLPVPMPIGNDLTQISTYDGSSNLLSQQVGPALTVVAGTLNTLGTPFSPIILDAAPGTITTTSGSGVSGSQPNFRINNSSVVTFILSQVDAGGTVFVPQPGLPTMTHAAATGIGASASMTGSELTLTPASSGRSTYAVVEADPAGTQDVTTTLTAGSAMGATSFTVASASGIYPGANLILDYETYSGSTFLQESALVTSVSGTTITVASGLTHAHSSSAGVQHYSDNLVSSADPFTVTISPVLIVPIGRNGGTAKALVYNGSFSLQAGSLTNSMEEFDSAQFDANDNLYILDAYNAFTVYRSAYTPGAGFGSVTTYSGIPNGSSNYIAFDVSANGTVAVENGLVTPELTMFAAGTSSNPMNFTSALDPSIWNTIIGSGSEPSVAVLTDRSSNVFGYAFDVFTLDTSATDEIVVTDGSSEQDLSSSSIISEYYSNPGESMITWDQGRQSLIFVNSGADTSGNCSILEFPRNGSTGASLQTTATTIGTVAGTPDSVAVSEDGSYVAVGWDSSGSNSGFTVSIFHNSGSAWSLASSSSSLARTTFSNLQGVHFLSNGNLVIVNGDNTFHTYENLQEFTNVGASLGSPYNVLNDFGGGYSINDFAASL